MCIIAESEISRYKRRLEADLRAGKPLTPELKAALDIWLALPIPLKIGDTVAGSHTPDHCIGMIRMIEGNEAWVQERDGHFTYQLTHLVRCYG